MILSCTSLSSLLINPQRIHSFASDKILQVVMPSQLHECAAEWVHDMIVQARMEGIIPQGWRGTMRIRHSPTYKNFVGEYRGRWKEADLTIIPLVGPDRVKKAKFPSVILESGWTETLAKLKDDARHWQVGSGQEVRVVLLVKFYQPNRQKRIRLDLFINRTRPGGQSHGIERYASFFCILYTTDFFTNVSVASVAYLSYP
ncbi:hypothetical protein L873DRAFT_869219 [Choiromyces venosus 120613-1]|uniref:Uncharacterized protein n=1 Tax=Choiromyces venosus 120613-1 TaxID=1336337 RepID=A0A3N4JP23_9PEZI|nr:hypothetical protein L873DRAFT_869219 [Choiromyces venosus 120613-1]